MSDEAPAVGRVVGIDLGERRIGVACSDSARRIALPREVVVRSGDRVVDRARLAALVAEAGATLVVVGLPVDLAGRVGPAAQAVLAEVEEMRGMLGELGVEVETWDERLSTAEADHRRREALAATDAARRGGRGGRRGPARAGVAERRSRPVLDDRAASLLLQGWLDAQHGGARRP